MAKGRGQRGPGGTHFPPKSLLPYGGFGDPALAAPYWHRPDDVSVDKLDASMAQDRLVRRVRLQLAAKGVTEGELEQQLGYKHQALSRKLNGSEMITLRDVLRIGAHFGSSVLTALVADSDQQDMNMAVVAEPAPTYVRPINPGEHSFHAAIHNAVSSLREAHKLLQNRSSTLPASPELAEALLHLAKVTAAIGASVAVTE